MTLCRLKWLLAVLIVLTCIIRPHTGSAVETKIMKAKKVEGFIVLPDVSKSMNANWTKGNCAGLDKLQVQFEIIRRFSAAIPQLHYVGAMRAFGIKNLISSDKDYSRVVYAPQKFDHGDFVAEVNKLEPTSGITPMGPAMVHAAGDLGTMGGRKALIIISDFEKSADFGDPVAEAAKLKDEYGRQICVYTIGITQSPKQVALAKEIAEASGCGRYFDGCSLYKDQAALDEAVKNIFYDEFNVVVDPDTDGDGVPDSRDKCPNTPLGAIVDARGCWIAAYGNFFDFDKADLKEQYLPHIRRIADVLKAHPDLNVVLDGHTDNVGSEEYNLKLGERRALAVRDALVEFGVEEERLKYASYGKTMPIADNETEDGRALNRRVEINVWQPGAVKSEPAQEETGQEEKSPEESTKDETVQDEEFQKEN
jgi:OOP family OmpA-OmpF porin